MIDNEQMHWEKKAYLDKQIFVIIITEMKHTTDVVRLMKKVRMESHLYLSFRTLNLKWLVQLQCYSVCVPWAMSTVTQIFVCSISTLLYTVCYLGAEMVNTEIQISITAIIWWATNWYPVQLTYTVLNNKTMLHIDILLYTQILPFTLSMPYTK